MTKTAWLEYQNFFSTYLINSVEHERFCKKPHSADPGVMSSIQAFVEIDHEIISFH